MKKFMISKIKKVTLIAFILVTTMIVSVSVSFAAEQEVPQINLWAMEDLNEGEKYGIFPVTWYFDGFQEIINQDKLKIVVDNLSKKIETLNLGVNDSFVAKNTTQDFTKENIVTLFYNILAKYKLPEINTYNPVEYMQKNGILNGTGKDLALKEECTVEQVVVLATRIIENTYKQVDAGSKGFLWKVTNNQNTMYLLGSIHIGDTDSYPLNDNLKEAFNQSSSLFVEANMLNLEGLEKFFEISTYSDGTTLEDHVSKETYEKALKVFDKLSIPKEKYIKSKPWSITNDLTVLTGSNSNSMSEASQAASLGVDLYFMTTALVKNKPIMELEGLEYQANLFDSLSNEYQEKALNELLDYILNPDDTDTGAENINLWQNQWRQADIESFKASYVSNLQKEDSSELNSMLLGTRDKNMAEKLSQLLDKEGQETYFVVVGSAHLAVDGMVIDQLKDKGYNVEFVK